MTSPVVIVIPARYASVRLPGKALAEIAGLPMIHHVHLRAQAVSGVDVVLVATDDERIASVVRGFGGEVVMTSPDHQSGSDRVWEAISGREAAIVVNVQGDEPLLDPQVVEAVIAPFVDPAVMVTTAATTLELADHHTSSVVKVVLDQRGDALYFSRSLIPSSGPALRHLGIYAYRREALGRFCAWPRGPLERAERLEQLRLLEHGERVRVVLVGAAGPSVDTPEDLERVRALFNAPAPA
jgi:3-deoxy-manno-octulosonate cytidylyltransferase (CMP-KDO synthetase)